jgi:hypothetical protein
LRRVDGIACRPNSRGRRCREQQPVGRVATPCGGRGVRHRPGGQSGGGPGPSTFGVHGLGGSVALCLTELLSDVGHGAGPPDSGTTGSGSEGRHPSCPEAASTAMPRPFWEGRARYSCPASLGRWRSVWRAWKLRHGSKPVSVASAISHVEEIFRKAGVPIGDILRRGSVRWVPLCPGRAVDHPLPLPLARIADLPRHLSRNSELRNGTLAWTNMIIACVNCFCPGTSRLLCACRLLRRPRRGCY